MTRTNVIEMGAVRDLLNELDKLRADVLAGSIQGWGGVVKHTNGREVVYIGGSFKTSASDRAAAMLRVSAVVMQREDAYLPPPKMVTVQ